MIYKILIYTIDLEESRYINEGTMIVCKRWRQTFVEVPSTPAAAQQS